MLLFDVNGQTLKRTDHFTPASDSEEYLKAQFTFGSSDWSGKTKTALFRLGTAVYKSVLNSNGICTVPAEVLVGGESRLARLHGSTIQVSLLGEYSTVRITTNEVDIKIPHSGYADAETPTTPTETEYTQMATVAADAVAKAEEARTACENARADLAGVKNIFANAVKGNLSGSVVFADDVSPVEHNPVVWVHGKNLAKSFKNESNGGGYANCLYIDGDLRPNTTYTVSFVGVAGHSIYFNENITTEYKNMKCTGSRQSMTFTTKPDISSQYYVGKGYVIAKNDASNAVSPSFFDVQIEEGANATGYEVYINPTSLTVKRYGKNLLPPHDTITQNGYTAARTSFGAVKVSGASNTDGAIYLNLSSVSNNPLVLRKGVKYSLLWSASNGRNGYMKLIDAEGKNYWLTLSPGQTLIDGDIYAEIVQLYIQIGANTANDPNSVEDTSLRGTYYFQLEVGGTSTDFEAYHSPVNYVPEEDGSVLGVASLSPNMTILTDTAGVIIECEYIRDTNKAIDRLTKAILALGGKV